MVLQVILLPLVALSGVVTGGALQGRPASLAVLTGVALMTGGAVLLGKGLLDLGRNLTPVPRPRTDAQLVETGIYSLVRHPIYGGIIVTAFGWALVATSLLTLAAGAPPGGLLRSQVAPRGGLADRPLRGLPDLHRPYAPVHPAGLLSVPSGFGAGTEASRTRRNPVARSGGGGRPCHRA